MRGVTLLLLSAEVYTGLYAAIRDAPIKRDQPEQWRQWLRATYSELKDGRSSDDLDVLGGLDVLSDPDGLDDTNAQLIEMGMTMLNPAGYAAGDAPLPIATALAASLKPHQLDGARFMFENVVRSLSALSAGDNGGGCVLAHSMGLGKSMQVVTLLHTLLRKRAGARAVLAATDTAAAAIAAATAATTDAATNAATDAAGGAAPPSAAPPKLRSALLVVPLNVLGIWDSEVCVS